MRRLLATTPALLYAGLIAYASHIPGLQPLFTWSWGDKLTHALVYAGFGMTLAFAVTAQHQQPSFASIAVWTLLLGALYAASDELHQLFVPNRVADFRDWLADVVGIGVSLLISRPLFRWWHRWLWKG
ncbi:MAG: VanZ family protein [Candidatus Kapabacteria bacterium]|nr:VanZ family protein [Candidatus Kapabacteria bacterium]MDW8012682.1 VanZ family protein [Bacteroidota bacterium]